MLKPMNDHVVAMISLDTIHVGGSAGIQDGRKTMFSALG